MPKKKGKKKVGIADKNFTINDSANAPKPVNRVKKSVAQDAVPEKTWEDLDDDFEIIEELDSEGVKSLVYKKKKSFELAEQKNTDDQGIVYPEIVWYLISSFIKPENVGRFAGINKTTYFITKRESFWRSLYRKYCQGVKSLPEKLMIENNNKIYGLRQRVIRGLYYTYKVFIHRVIIQETFQESKPHHLINRRCVNLWYTRGHKYSYVYFKLKKCNPQRIKDKVDFFEELCRIDANPEEDTQVLQVVCKGFYGVPPLMGMTLSSLRLVLSRGMGYHRLHLGFNSGSYSISRNITPERSIVIDTVVGTFVYDWWLPKYPYFENSLPLNRRDEESLPVLKEDFFAVCNNL